MREKCKRCDGCGKIASDEQGSPWTAWERLPPGSDLAARLGLVLPVRCPDCGGTGTGPEITIAAFAFTESDVLVAAAAIANSVGGRRGVPEITNVLALVGEKRRGEFIEDARAALKAVAVAKAGSEAR
jgi:hypothetical protein